MQQKYKTVLKKDGINFKDGHICCEYLSKGYRNSTDDIPDITIPASQVPIIEIKYKETKEHYNKLKNPKDFDKACL